MATSDIKEIFALYKVVKLIAPDKLHMHSAKVTGFVFPSIYEGFGILPLEVQAMGCPVLLSNIAPFKEKYGDSAIYCDPFIESDILRKLLSLLTDETLRKH